MKTTRNIITTIFCALLLLAVFSCGKHKQWSGKLEGKVIYDVTYPYEEASILLDLYPKEMVLYFKGDKMKSDIRSSYDLLVNQLIIDNDDKSFVQLMKNMSSRIGMKLNEEETRQWYAQHEQYTFKPTTETTTIAGYVCTKTIAHAAGDSSKTIEIYHTRGTGLDMDNWWNPYQGIEGFLMAYDIEQYGLCMRLRAREVKFENIDDQEFLIPDAYPIKDQTAMNAALAEVVSEFVK